MPKIIYGVYNQRGLIGNSNLYNRVKGNTLFYLNRLSKVQKEPLHIISNDKVEDLLNQALKEEYDYCVVIAAGTQITKTYKFVPLIEDFINNNDFGIAGHLIQRPGEWLELHPQFFIVNVKAWSIMKAVYDEVSLPGSTELYVLERSLENFHNTHTPLWVKKTNHKALQTGAGKGWRLLHSMFEQNHKVITLSKEIRASKFYLYPEKDPEKFLTSMKELKVQPQQNYNQSKWLNTYIDSANKTWLFNSESLLTTYTEKQYDIVMNPASGFKLFDLFLNNKIKQDTRIIIYDNNKTSIDWYKHLHAWQNNNLNDCIKAYANKDNFIWLNQQNQDSFEQNYSIVKEHFKDKFNDCWNDFKQSRVEFYIINLYTEAEKVAELLQGPGTKWINLSNIFAFELSQLTLGLPYIAAAQAKLLYSLYVVDSEINVSFVDCMSKKRVAKVKELL